MRDARHGPGGEILCARRARELERDARALALAEPRPCECGCGEQFVAVKPNQRFVDGLTGCARTGNG
jgi:hypothetical protein